MRTLILAEKPSVAADFAAALGATRQNGYYANEDTIIAYCIGHLLELYEPDDYDPAYKKWTVEALPIIPERFRYKPRPTTTAQLRIVTKLLGQPFDRLIIATDAGREGELIARTVLSHAQVKDLSRALRFWSSEALTPEVILKNLNTLKPARDYDALYAAGLYRQLADWLAGYNFTRLLSVKMDATFPFGRVQTALLTLLVRRSREIASFTPTPRYQLAVTASTKDNQSFTAYYTDGSTTLFPEEQHLRGLAADLSQIPLPALVTTLEKKRNRTPPPQLYNLTALQKDANKYLGLTAEQTLAAVQSLYETHKCLSYPRTPSRVLATSTVPLFTRIVAELRAAFPDLFASAGAVNPTDTRIFDDDKLEDHHALIALAPPPPELTQAQRSVYDLVVKNIAATLAPSHDTETTTATLGAMGCLFRATATAVLTEGWRALYVQAKESQGDQADDDELPTAPSLPPLAEGETVTITNPAIATKPTKPPRPYTEAAALALMEKHHLGTEATRAGILEKLVADKYCGRSKRNLIPTDKAAHLISAIESLTNPALSRFTTPEETEAWENRLASDPAAFLRDIKDFIQTSFLSLKEVTLARYQAHALGNCPLCNAPIRESAKAYYCTRYKEGCKFNLWKSIAHHTLTAADIKAILSGKATKLVSLKKKNGETFTARLAYNIAIKDVEFIYDAAKDGGKSRNQGANV